jgi:hypothetical protein
MLIKDIILVASSLINRQDVKVYLEEEKASDYSTLNTVNNLLCCANLVINELACTYIPMIKTEKIATVDGKIYYSSLSETPLEIKDVFDDYGNSLLYIVHHEYVDVGLNEVNVEYKYLPTNYAINEKIGYEERQVSARVLAYGVCSEFLLMEKAFDESIMWHERYMQELSFICTPKNAKIKGRSFC